MLERISFQGDPSDAEVLEAELRRTGLDPELWIDRLRDGLGQVLATPLGGPLDSLALRQLSPERRLHELSFDLPVSHMVTSRLVEVFRREPESRFGEDYIPHLEQLAINSRGFHRLDRSGLQRSR